MNENKVLKERDAADVAELLGTLTVMVCEQIGHMGSEPFQRFETEFHTVTVLTDAAARVAAFGGFVETPALVEVRERVRQLVGVVEPVRDIVLTGGDPFGAPVDALFVTCDLLLNGGLLAA